MLCDSIALLCCESNVFNAVTISIFSSKLQIYSFGKKHLSENRLSCHGPAIQFNSMYLEWLKKLVIHSSNCSSTHPSNVHRRQRWLLFCIFRPRSGVAKSQYQTKKEAIFDLLANRKKDALTNLEEKERNEKRWKKITEASDFGDKLICLNMIVSHKPNLILPLANSYYWVYRFTMESKVILLMLTALGGVIASPNLIAESGHKGGRYLIT